MSNDSFISIQAETWMEWIRQWMWKQHVHDELYHPDIARLSTKRRLTHLALHLMKYQSTFLQHLHGMPNDDMYLKDLMKAFIITTSMANVVKVNIPKFLHGKGIEVLQYKPGIVDEMMTSKALGECMRQSYWHEVFSQRGSRVWSRDFVLTVAIPHHLGLIAKTLESHDHMESFEYKSTLDEAVSGIWCMLLGLLTEEGVELELQVENVLSKVRQANPLHHMLKDSLPDS